MTNMSIQPLWLTHFIEILLVLEFQLTKTYLGTFSYKAHFRPKFPLMSLFDVMGQKELAYQSTRVEELGLLRSWVIYIPLDHYIGVALIFLSRQCFLKLT